MRVGGYACSARHPLINSYDSPPLGKACAHLEVLHAALPEPIEPLCNLLTGMVGEFLSPGVDLDTWMDSSGTQRLGDWGAIVHALPDCLVEQYHAADCGLIPISGEQVGAVGASSLGRGVDSDGSQSLRHRTVALICSEYPLARGHKLTSSPL